VTIVPLPPFAFSASTSHSAKSYLLAMTCRLLVYRCPAYQFLAAILFWKLISSLALTTFAASRCLNYTMPSPGSCLIKLDRAFNNG
jgi:hypothetical protein